MPYPPSPPYSILEAAELFGKDPTAMSCTSKKTAVPELPGYSKFRMSLFPFLGCPFLFNNHCNITKGFSFGRKWSIQHKSAWIERAKSLALQAKQQVRTDCGMLSRNRNIRIRSFVECVACASWVTEPVVCHSTHCLTTQNDWSSQTDIPNE